MPPDQSITSSLSFQARLLHAERWRLALLAGCFLALAMIWLVRRAFGGLVASTDTIFYPILGILGVGMLLLGFGFIDATRRLKRGGVFPRGRATASAVIDLFIPFGCLLLLQVNSPRGAYSALSGPSLLLVPIVILLSVLRLKPRFSLILGLASAVAHWALAYRAIMVADLAADTWPVIFSYGVLIALTGAAAATLATVVRRYIEEAVRESESAERAGRALSEVQHELEIARHIQLGLLPSEPPTIREFDIAAMARPATQAGGDYYDWQPLADGRLVVAIADVTGHGVGPALVMAVCRAYARATAPMSNNSREFLERMNRLIVQDIKGSRFITMAVAIVSPSGDVELLSAGHGPTFLFRKATNTLEHFGGNGLPLGVDRDEEFKPAEQLHLDPGDALVLLTDGFMEHAGPDGAIFGLNRLSNAVSANALLPAKDLITAIDRAVTEFAAGSPQGDDMTAVVIRRR